MEEKPGARKEGSGEGTARAPPGSCLEAQRPPPGCTPTPAPRGLDPSWAPLAAPAQDTSQGAQTPGCPVPRPLCIPAVLEALGDSRPSTHSHLLTVPLGAAAQVLAWALNGHGLGRASITHKSGALPASGGAQPPKPGGPPSPQEPEPRVCSIAIY